MNYCFSIEKAKYIKTVNVMGQSEKGSGPNLVKGEMNSNTRQHD